MSKQKGTKTDWSIFPLLDAVNFYGCHTKNRLGWHHLSQAFFCYDTGHKISSVLTSEHNCIAGVVPKEGLAGLVPAKPYIGMTMTTIFLRDLTQAALGVPWVPEEVKL